MWLTKHSGKSAVIFVLAVATLLSPLFPLWASAQGTATPAAPAIPSTTVPRAETSNTTILPTDVVPLAGGQERTSFGENFQLRLMQRLPSRFYFSGSFEMTERYETNPFQFPKKRQLIRQLPPPPVVRQLDFIQQDRLNNIIGLASNDDLVFRLLPNVSGGWTVTPHTRLFCNYFMIRDQLSHNIRLNTIIHSLGAGLQQDIPLTTRGNLQVELQARNLWQLHQQSVFDYLPGVTFSYIVNPRTVFFANALIQARGKAFFVAPVKELDPFYTWGFLHQRNGWTFSASSTFVQNFRHQFRAQATIPTNNYVFILDFEVARRILKQLPGLQAFARMEPIYNFHSNNTPGLAGMDFRAFFGMRFAVAKPALTATMGQIRQQLEETETVPSKEKKKLDPNQLPKPSAFNLQPHEVTAHNPQPIHGFLAHGGALETAINPDGEQPILVGSTVPPPNNLENVSEQSLPLDQNEQLENVTNSASCSSTDGIDATNARSATDMPPLNLATTSTETGSDVASRIRDSLAVEEADQQEPSLSGLNVTSPNSAQAIDQVQEITQARSAVEVHSEVSKVTELQTSTEFQAVAQAANLAELAKEPINPKPILDYPALRSHTIVAVSPPIANLPMTSKPSVPVALPKPSAIHPTMPPATSMPGPKKSYEHLPRPTARTIAKPSLFAAIAPATLHDKHDAATTAIHTDLHQAVQADTIGAPVVRELKFLPGAHLSPVTAFSRNQGLQRSTVNVIPTREYSARSAGNTSIITPPQKSGFIATPNVVPTKSSPAMTATSKPDSVSVATSPPVSELTKAPNQPLFLASLGGEIATPKQALAYLSDTFRSVIDDLPDGASCSSEAPSPTAKSSTTIWVEEFEPEKLTEPRKAPRTSSKSRKTPMKLIPPLPPIDLSNHKNPLMDSGINLQPPVVHTR